MRRCREIISCFPFSSVPFFVGMSDINPIVIGMGRSEVVESYKSNPMVHRVEGTAMEQDFTKGLSVCIGNYGYYNEGELHDT